MRKLTRATLVALLLFAGLCLNARAESPLVAFEAAEPLAAGQWVELALDDGAREFTFAPENDDEYMLCAFPLESSAHVRAELYVDSLLLASGDGTRALASAQLTAGANARVVVTGSGRAAFEIARAAKSRCCELPVDLRDGGGYTKQIVRPGDDHWFQVRAETGGAALISCASEDGLQIDATLMDESGLVLSRGLALPSGAQALWTEFEAGRAYLLRISALDGGVGRCRVEVRRSANTRAPSSIEVKEDNLVVTGRSTGSVEVSFAPEDACALVYLDSDDRSVVNADERTTIEGREAGTALITVTAYGGAQTTCRVTVENVSVQRIRFPWDEVSMAVGDQLAVSASLEPVNATNRAISYRSANEDVVRVSEDGVLTALEAGKAEIYATSLDRNLLARLTVTVQPAAPRCRALLVGEQNYSVSVDAAREGSVRSVEGVMSLLKRASFNGREIGVTALMDAPRDSVIAAIRRVFGEARDGDVSILYLTCHGFYRAGMTHFVMADGSVLAASDLARELATISGEIVVLADCCASGGLIDAESAPTDLSQGVARAFNSVRGTATLTGSDVHVLASACLDQDSYRIGGGDDMATAFGVALCEAAGWDLEKSEPAEPRADGNRDGTLTLDETARYCVKSVARQLGEAGSAYTQTVCVYPEHDSFGWLEWTKQ